MEQMYAGYYPPPAGRLEAGPGQTFQPAPQVSDALTDEFLQQFGVRLAQLITPAIPVHTLQAAITRTIAEAQHALASRQGAAAVPGGVPGNAAAVGGVQKAPRKLELVFVHDCRNHGCNRGQCVLCKHNPNKRCTGNFAHKYWVGDKLLAKCEGEIQVELLDAMTGERVTDDMSQTRIEVCILDGNKYNSRCREAGEQRLEILDECEVLRNQKAEPLLISSSHANDSQSPQVVLKFQSNQAVVPLRDLKVTESSESVLAGTKRPPFRLVVRAIRPNGTRLNIRPAVSEEFVVVTKRTKNLKKQEIPSLDDPISKLNHIGKETVKKLNELKASADEVGLELNLPPDLFRVTKVRQFQKLARLSEADGHMQQKLKQLLKLSKEKWDSACEHAKTAVQVDNRMRAWYMKNMSIGLLYNCALGDIRPDYPVALIQNRQHPDGGDYMEVVPMEHQLPAQREQVNGTCEQATRCWWEDSHPGWMIFTLGNQHFETLDQIIQFSNTDAPQLSGGAAASAPHSPDDSGVPGPGPRGGGGAGSPHPGPEGSFEFRHDDRGGAEVRRSSVSGQQQAGAQRHTPPPGSGQMGAIPVAGRLPGGGGSRMDAGGGGGVGPEEPPPYNPFENFAGQPFQAGQLQQAAALEGGARPPRLDMAAMSQSMASWLLPPNGAGPGAGAGLPPPEHANSGMFAGFNSMWSLNLGKMGSLGSIPLDIYQLPSVPLEDPGGQNGLKTIPSLDMANGLRDALGLGPPGGNGNGNGNGAKRQRLERSLSGLNRTTSAAEAAADVKLEPPTSEP